MHASTHPLDRIYRLGAQIEEAIAAGDWLRLSELVQQRTQIIRRLESMHDGRVGLGLSVREEQEKVKALIEQQKRLATLLRKERNEVDEELAEIEQLEKTETTNEATEQASPEVESSNVMG